ncbi:nuclease-related domain-containing protein [Nitrogeniibacter aestuarii]|uniref:nuclease-related domain-containing protein n=1 Tax=Nitrogeniibacter aestuarii TaxID=2815343 RepID=UPI001E593F91|nr:nuclease-related domain-containing protein [Nitrogeniibacter aestuarii]
MILKNADDKASSIAQLELLLKTGRVPDKQVKHVEKEVRLIKAGIKGEAEAAYLIDFYMKDSKRTAVIHDLRLELADGRVAQIDHLLIHHTYRFYVLETKHFNHGLKITDEGEFLRWNDWNKTYEGFPSPIEQNQRHALVLARKMEEIGLPKAEIKSLILVAPHARVIRSKVFDSSMVVKADQFLTALEKDLENAGVFNVLGGFAKAKFIGSVEEIGKKIARYHRPTKINYVAKFGLANAKRPAAVQAEAAEHALVETVEAVLPAGAAIDDERPPKAAFICRHCSSDMLAIEYGRYGYYFKCKACGGNTPIKLGCGVEGHKERLRKAGARFYRECEACGSSVLYFCNE